jgi:hypothetical protein
MTRREPDRPRVLGDGVETECPGVVDQGSEHPPPAREVADLRTGLVVDAVGDEPLEARAGASTIRCKTTSSDNSELIAIPVCSRTRRRSVSCVVTRESSHTAQAR